jgi:sugar (pentulose or hexulose) kinase
MRRVAVIDIGKTNVKLAVVDPAAGAELTVETAPNAVRPGPPWPHFDTAAQWAFLAAALRRAGPVEGIAVTTHGACAALLQADGTLAAPVLDYEHAGPDDLRAEYEAIRPPFAETGSPALPRGLNLGAQLHWQLRQDPALPSRVAQVVTWPQYWGFRLTGQMASDVCSLGCHTDLWNPWAGTWSALPARLGLGGRMAPARRPAEVLGILTAAAQAETGLGPVPVLCGIHDSNASLLPHLVTRAPPFAVVSTGTWVIAMAVGGAPVAPDPRRDTLINVDAFGRPTPSARFMGGRERDLLLGPGHPAASAEDLARIAAQGLMLWPGKVTDCGPFPGLAARWSAEPGTAQDRAAAVDACLALVTATCLQMTGAAGPSLVEGPFAANPVYLSMLAAATGRPAIASPARTGTALGAARLFDTAARPTAAAAMRAARSDPALAAYAAAWSRGLPAA